MDRLSTSTSIARANTVCFSGPSGLTSQWTFPPPKCSREGNHWELKAKHARHLVLVKHYPDGEIVKVTKFAEDVKEKMMNDELPITKQQKVKLG